jgi:5'-3' exonuclease
VRLHVVDGTYELYRAHYSHRPEQETKATIGLIASMLALLHDPDEAVTHIAVAFDNPIRSFRNDLFPAYKSDEGVPPELHAQFDLVEDAVRAMGIVVWSMRDYEADDALATAARRFAGADVQVRILSPDKDLAQCLQSDRVVQVDRRQEKVTDEAAFRRVRGFGPASVPDLLALTGDAADGIPGLPGFGQKSASVLLGAYEHLESIPDAASDWKVALRGAPRLAATLSERRDEVYLYRKLATLVTTVPLAEELEALRFAGVPRAPFSALCDRLGVTTQRTAPKRWA